MNEQDYIDATNLTKIRIARTLVYDLLAMRPGEEVRQKALLRELTEWMEALEHIVDRRKRE